MFHVEHLLRSGSRLLKMASSISDWILGMSGVLAPRSGNLGVTRRQPSVEGRCQKCSTWNALRITRPRRVSKVDSLISCASLCGRYPRQWFYLRTVIIHWLIADVPRGTQGLAAGAIVATPWRLHVEHGSNIPPARDRTRSGLPDCTLPSRQSVWRIVPRGTLASELLRTTFQRAHLRRWT